MELLTFKYFFASSKVSTSESIKKHPLNIFSIIFCYFLLVKRKESLENSPLFETIEKDGFENSLLEEEILKEGLENSLLLLDIEDEGLLKVAETKFCQ